MALRVNAYENYRQSNNHILTSSRKVHPVSPHSLLV
jgi:hypothetical protein